MVEVKELEWEKREELYRGMIQWGISFEEAKKLFEYLEDECVIEIVPPQMEEACLETIKLKAVHTGRFRGKSYKPGNIIVNIRDAITDSVILGVNAAATVGAVSASQPLIAIFTILSAVLSVAKLGEIKLDDNAALLLAAFWENRYEYGEQIDLGVGLELVNEYLESYNRETMSEVQYNDLLEDLQTVGSIMLDNGKIRLIEKVHIKY